MRFKNPVDPIGGPVMGFDRCLGAGVVHVGHAAYLADAEERIRRKISLRQQSRC